MPTWRYRGIGESVLPAPARTGEGSSGIEPGYRADAGSGRVTRQLPAVFADTSDVPTPIAADIAKEARAAIDALGRTRTVLAKAGSVPAALLMEADSDPIYGRAEPRTDWYIEPLLTPNEVASILRLSRSAVARLGIPSLLIEGERRYRQSELRRYLMNNESRY